MMSGQMQKAGSVRRWAAGIALGAVIAALGAPVFAEDAPLTPHQQQLERERKLPNDVAALQPLAEYGNSDAQNRLGLLYINGKGGLPKDIAKGIEWLRKSAAQNNAVAQLNLGLMAGAGLGMPKDEAEAVRLFRLSAEQGNPGGQNHLGFAYEHGIGIVQSYTDALTWYRKAADQDEAEAQFNLGIMAERGEGIAKDETVAIQWLRKAAERGYALAQVDLANHYLTGQGAPSDPGLAYFWSAIGVSHVAPNQIAVASTVRERASHLLAPDEVMRIQGLAAQWHPGVDVATLMPSSTPSDKMVLPKGATVVVRSTGTGFAVTKDGFALTNAHVVPSCKSLLVHAPDGTSHPATLINRDERVDLALLKVDHTFAHTATFRDDRPIRQGDEVVVYGFPLIGVLTDQGNLTTGMVSALAGIGNDSRLIQISAPVQPGNSGGPVVDASGNLVGVVVSKLNALKMASATGDVAQNINFAIKANVARDFLEANAVTYASAKSAKKMDTADLADRMKAYTVEVQCDR